MTAGVLNHTGRGSSIIHSARALMTSWMRPGVRQVRQNHRPPQGMDLVNAAADELARDPHIQSVQRRHTHVAEQPAMEFVVVPARPEFTAYVDRSCAQMAAIVTPVTRQESLDVRFHVGPTR